MKKVGVKLNHNFLPFLGSNPKLGSVKSLKQITNFIKTPTWKSIGCLHSKAVQYLKSAI